MDHFLVHSVDVRGPAVHAIVVGVAAYPHLNGGTGPLTARHEGMAQISSAGPSARSVASWLVETLNDPGKPLATVSLLLAEADPQPFLNRRTGTAHPVEPASMANVKAAVRAWGSRGRHEDDRLIFYFCGHGVANGPDVSLLLSDFGADPFNPLDASIDLRKMLLGLEAIAAREQCFFIDACRANSETAVGAAGYLGDPIFMPDIMNLPLPAGPPRLAPVYYSTVPGQAAFGIPGRPSPFTAALILALTGLGSNDNEGDWRVSTVGLKEAIDFLMDRAFGVGWIRAQVPATNNLSTFFLHYLDGSPAAHVFVGCRPEHANALADFRCLQDGEVKKFRGPAQAEWELELQPGYYEFIADFAAGQYRRAAKHWYVLPPYRKVPLEVLQP